MIPSLRTRLGVFSSALFVLLACIGSIALHAQTSTQGSVTGTVTDPSGAVIGGASISITNGATNAQFKTTADGSGNFSFPLLEPGTYSVSIAAPGFASYRADNVVVNVGQVTSILPHLALASSQSEVVVTEQVPVMNTESPDFTDTLNTKALQSIPINNRRWSSLAMTTPGVVADSSGFGLVSVRGISTLLNNVEIDGADDNQAYFSEERGRTREAYSTSGSAVREFAVNSGVYSAEYGRAAGGVITSVTKSGTNQLHGQAYFWDRESNWNAYNDFTDISVLNPTTNQYVSTHIKPEDLRKIYGFTAGGPLKKDKLFWIYTYDQHTHVFPGFSVPENPSAFYSLPTPAASLPSSLSASDCNLSSGYWSASSTSSSSVYDPNFALDAQACTLAAREYAAGNPAANSYQGGVTLWDAGIASLATDLGEVPRVGYQEINTPKLDWQINDKEHLSVLGHRLRWDAPGDVQTGTAEDYGRDTWGNNFVKLDYGVTKLTSLITSNISNEALYQYSRELDYNGQQAFTPFTLNNLVGSTGNVPEVAMDTTEGMNIGSPYYSYQLRYPDEHKWQVGDIVYWNKGNHTLKFGVDLLHNYDLYNTLGSDGNGYYIYNYPGNYFADQYYATAKASTTCNSNYSEYATGNTASTTAVGTYPCYEEYFQTYGSDTYAIATLDSGVFAQDNWKFSPRLTFELGLRWDKETIPPANPNFISATGNFTPYNGIGNNPSDNREFGPRIGFSYDLYGSGNTILRGGYGMYYGRITNGNILNVRFATGSPNGQYNTEYYNAPYKTIAQGPNLPQIFSNTGGSVQGNPTSFFFAPNLKNPEVHEFDLMLQQAVGRGTFFQLSYLGALGRDLPNYLDVNLNPASIQDVTITVVDSTNSGPLGPNGKVYANIPTYTSYGNTALLGANAANFNAITEYTSDITSNYNAFVAEVLNRSLRSIQFDANYTWSHALDYSQNAATGGETNYWYDPFSNPRINYGDSDWNIPNRFVAYALYNFPNMVSGSMLKWVTNDWSLNDSFQMQNGLPWTVSVSGSNSADAISSDWNGAGGQTLIPGIGLNTKRYPRHIVDDSRLQKVIPIKEGKDLQLMLNVFNVANHQNVDGIGSTAYKLAKTGSTGLTGSATFQNSTFGIVTSSNNSGFLYTPRQVEIAARFNF